MKKLLIISSILFALASCNSETETKVAADTQILDPICKMVKTDDWTETSETHGQTFYFCSPVCKEQFDKDPHKYMDAHSH
jgi:YHS domain-containing protein